MTRVLIGLLTLYFSVEFLGAQQPQPTPWTRPDSPLFEELPDGRVVPLPVVEPSAYRQIRPTPVPTPASVNLEKEVSSNIGKQTVQLDIGKMREVIAKIKEAHDNNLLSDNEADIEIKRELTTLFDNGGPVAHTSDFKTAAEYIAQQAYSSDGKSELWAYYIDDQLHRDLTTLEFVKLLQRKSEDKFILLPNNEYYLFSTYLSNHQLGKLSDNEFSALVRELSRVRAFVESDSQYSSFKDSFQNQLEHFESERSVRVKRLIRQLEKMQQGGFLKTNSVSQAGSNTLTNAAFENASPTGETKNLSQDDQGIPQGRIWPTY